MIVSILVGASIGWHVGVLAFLILFGAPFLFGYSLARCPRCGQVWWPVPRWRAPWLSDTTVPPEEDETDSFVCRRCRIDIGLAFRDRYGTKS